MAVAVATRLLCALVLGAAAWAPLHAQTPRSISGIALDTQGKPLAGALVRVRADFLYGRAEATTGADGRYDMRDLLRTTYRVEAWVQRDYAGGTVCQRLAMASPSDYNSFDVARGAVRNFRWQLTGRVGLTNGNFGADITMWMEDTDRSAARAVEFTLTPTGPLIDGSRGAPLVREAPLRYPASDDGLRDIALGTYRLSAVLIGKDNRRRPLLIATQNDMDFRPVVDVAWRPDRFCGMSSDSGVEPFLIRVRTAG
jgi:hypothetical protein